MSPYRTYKKPWKKLRNWATMSSRTVEIGEFSLLYPEQDTIVYGSFNYLTKLGALRLGFCKKCNIRVYCIASIEEDCKLRFMELDE